MKIPLLGPSYESRSREESDQKLVNMYLVENQANNSNSVVAYPTPGAKSFSTNAGASVRALFSQNDVLYGIIDNKFYSFDSVGSKTELGTLNTSSGRCQIVGTNVELLVNDKVTGYIYNISTGTFTEIATAQAFPKGTNTVDAQDGFFVAHEDQKFYLSNALAGSTWDALDFASAEGDPDDIQAIKSFQRKLFLLGRVSTEVWFNTGASTFPFSRIEGVYIDYGCAAPDSAAVGDNALFFLASGKNGQLAVVQVDESFNDVIISTQALNSEFLTYDKINDAIGFVYQQEGREFYVLTFPTEDKTWVLDTKSGMWHSRSSRSGGIDRRHLANNVASFNNNIIIGDYNSGNLYEWDTKTYTDNGNIIVRKIKTSPYMNDSRDFFINRLEVDFDNAAALVTGQGSDPQVMLRLSKDGGFTWGNRMYRSIGKIGEYRIRALWNRLGTGRRIAVELQMSDPVEWIILNGYMEIEPGVE